KEVFFDSQNPTVLQGLVEEFYRILDVQMSDEEVPPVEVTVTSDGLRLLIYDRQDTPYFKDGSVQLTDWGEFLTQNLAWLLTRFPFHVIIESHSGELDALHQDEWSDQYGAWELTADRANEIRRQLQFYANGELDIKRVSGYGITQPLPTGSGAGRTNQRVCLSLSLSKEFDGTRSSKDHPSLELVKTGDQEED
ncbi:MAG: OmpA family protein, partial [Verrucomicrobiae bacterium]|nr:OmpA family protein [Verrucomicrobiae bacterium]